MTQPGESPGTFGGGAGSAPCDAAMLVVAHELDMLTARRYRAAWSVIAGIARLDTYIPPVLRPGVTL